jgi:general secretion pathway protein G
MTQPLLVNSERPLQMNTKRYSIKRRLARGVTLVEILIVLAIIGLIAGGVAAVAVPQFKKAQVKQAKNDCRNSQQIADSWRADHPSECPTMEKLKADRVILPGANIMDPWGKVYVIRCDGDDLRVASFGPDGKEGTPDDISVPEEAARENP